MCYFMVMETSRKMLLCSLCSFGAEIKLFCGFDSTICICCLLICSPTSRILLIPIYIRSVYLNCCKTRCSDQLYHYCLAIVIFIIYCSLFRYRYFQYKCQMCSGIAYLISLLNLFIRFRTQCYSQRLQPNKFQLAARIEEDDTMKRLK